VLRRAPSCSDSGFYGAFFAGQLEVAAHSRITYEPFDHWFELVDIHPVLDCVRRYKAPYGAALFGYENESDFPVTVPLGPANHVTEAPLPGSPPPTTEAMPPMILEPGMHPRAFWAPLFWESPEVSGSVSWTLGNEAVIATASGLLCQPGQVPPEEEAPMSGPFFPAEDPSGVGPTAMSRLVSAVVSDYSSVLPAPVFGGVYVQKLPLVLGTGAIGTTQQPLEAQYSEVSPPPNGPFTFEMTELHNDTGEGLCGKKDPYVRDLIVNGVNFGRTDKVTVTIPRTQETVPVHVNIWDVTARFERANSSG
jgi:hypothetical protein